jgi:hypothetical protein
LHSRNFPAEGSGEYSGSKARLAEVEDIDPLIWWAGTQASAYVSFEWTASRQNKRGVY